MFSTSKWLKYVNVTGTCHWCSLCLVVYHAPQDTQLRYKITWTHQIVSWRLLSIYMHKWRPNIELWLAHALCPKVFGIWVFRLVVQRWISWVLPRECFVNALEGDTFASNSFLIYSHSSYTADIINLYFPCITVQLYVCHINILLNC